MPDNFTFFSGVCCKCTECVVKCREAQCYFLFAGVPKMLKSMNLLFLYMYALYTIDTIIHSTPTVYTFTENTLIYAC